MNRILRCCFLTLVVLLGAALGAGDPPPPAAELQPAVAVSHRVEKLKQAFRSGDKGRIDLAMQEVDQLCRAYGTLDLQPLVEAMSLWARDLGEQGDPGLGIRVVDEIDRWAPGHPAILSTRVVLKRRQGPSGYIWSLPDVLNLNRLRLEHPTHRWLWVAQHFGWARFMATLLLWGWTLAMVLRYRNVLRYLWEEPLSRKGMGSLAMAAVGVVVLAAPVMLRMDPGVSALVCLWLLAPFLHTSEVRATCVVLVLQLLHPALMLVEPAAAQEPSPSIVALQLQPQATPMDAWARTLPPGDQAFLKGWRQLQLQDWAGAEGTFNAILATHPDRAQVLNNLGVALYQQGRVQEARQRFEEAHQAGPERAETLINLGILAYGRLESKTGEDLQALATRADKVRSDRIQAALGSVKEERTFAAPLPDTSERVEALKRAHGKQQVYEVKHLNQGVLALGLVLPILGLVAFIIRLRRSVKQAHPTQCIRCGEPFHTTDSPDAEVCSRCHHLFVLKDGLHGESRKRKVEEVAEFQGNQRWFHRALIVLAPGLDLCFLGETRRGFLEFSFLAFALGIVFATGRSVRYPGEILPDPASTWMSLGLALLAVLVLRSWLKLLPRRRG